jgi:multisubunit Na+/H+ antiporter MnhB subunit
MTSFLSYTKKYLLAIFLLFLFSAPVYAYLDPGTGSILIQGLIGGVAAVLSFLSIYWHKVKAFFGKNKSKKEEVDRD